MLIGDPCPMQRLCSRHPYLLIFFFFLIEERQADASPQQSGSAGSRYGESGACAKGHGSGRTQVHSVSYRPGESQELLAIPLPVPKTNIFFFLAPPNMASACSHVGVVPRRPRPQNAVPMGATSCPWRRRRRRRRPLARGRKRRRRRDLAAPSKRRGGAGSPSRPVGAARSEEQGGGPGGPATPGKEQEPGKERT